MIQLAPDLAPRRVKLGWASDADRRLRAHRTSAPTATILRLWRCDRDREYAAIRAVAAGCRPLSREAFEADDLSKLLVRADRFFGPDARLDQGLTLPEAAALRGLTLRTLQAAAKSGALRARRFGGKVWATTLRDVDEWVRDSRHRPGPPPRTRTGSGGRGD